MCICICVCACMCVPVINYDNETKKLYSPFGCSNFIKVLKVTMFCCLRQLIHVKLKTSLQMLKQNVVKQCRSKQLLYSMFDKSIFFLFSILCSERHLRRILADLGLYRRKPSHSFSEIYGLIKVVCLIT